MKKILIVEDDPAFSEILRTRIKGHYKAEVKVVFNGEEALEAVKKQKFDLILLDVLLPGIDGYTLAMQIRDLLFLQTPIVVITAVEDSTVKDKFQELKIIKDYLIKPLEGKDLFRKLDPFLK